MCLAWRRDGGCPMGNNCRKMHQLDLFQKGERCSTCGANDHVSGCTRPGGSAYVRGDETKLSLELGDMPFDRIAQQQSSHDKKTGDGIQYEHAAAGLTRIPIPQSFCDSITNRFNGTDPELKTPEQVMQLIHEQIDTVRRSAPEWRIDTLLAPIVRHGGLNHGGFGVLRQLIRQHDIPLDRTYPTSKKKAMSIIQWCFDHQDVQLL